MFGPVRITLKWGPSRRTWEMTRAPRSRDVGLTDAWRRWNDAKVPLPPTSESARSFTSTFQVKGWMETEPMASFRPVASSMPFEAWVRTMPGTTKATSAARSSASATRARAPPPIHFQALEEVVFPVIEGSGYFFFALSGS